MDNKEDWKTNMVDRNIKAIVRGHLISVDKKAIKLKRFEDELYLTKFYTIIISNNEISFKTKEGLIKIRYDEVTEFYLKDCETFVFRVEHGEKQYFKIV